jgi:osmoprotectant transport system substrate-binding protein
MTTIRDRKTSSQGATSLTRRDALIKAAAGGLAVTVALRTAPEVLASAPASPATAGSLKVGAKDFTEDQLIGHMYTLLLEQAGFSVSEHFNLPTAIAHQALVKGDIDMYPEYTGTGLEVILKGSAPHTSVAYYKAAAAGYEKQFHLTWLSPAPMNDTQGLATTQAISKQYGIKTISDMVKQASKLRFIVNSEFLTRPDGLPGLKKADGNFSFRSQVVVAGAGSLRYAALTQGRGDVVVAFTTDGLIAGDHLVVLQDDKGYAPPDNVAPVVRDIVLKSNPQIKATLNKLAPKLTSSAITSLNYKVDGQHEDLPTVAKTFLQQQGLLK